MTNPIHDRQRFYNDPAIKLSDENLDEFNGTEGAPVCVEHDTKDVVGVVHHTWIGDGDNRALKMIGKIDKHSQRGKQIISDIKAGKLKGLSVGYGADLVTNQQSGITALNGKRFREISLVAEPFFENCNLSSYVEASANANSAQQKKVRSNLVFKNCVYNSK